MCRAVVGANDQASNQYRDMTMTVVAPLWNWRIQSRVEAQWLLQHQFQKGIQRQASSHQLKLPVNDGRCSLGKQMNKLHIIPCVWIRGNRNKAWIHVTIDNSCSRRRKLTAEEDHGAALALLPWCDGEGPPLAILPPAEEALIRADIHNIPESMRTKMASWMHGTYSPCTKNKCRDHRQIYLDTMSRLNSLNNLITAE